MSRTCLSRHSTLTFNNEVTMARAAKARAQQSLYADSDSDPDENTDVEETPRAQTRPGKAKKRVSDVFQPNDRNDSSPQRVPFQTVNFNDDEAEKRKRRRSAKLAQTLSLIDENNGNTAQAEASGTGDTPRAAKHLRHKQQLLAVADTPAIDVPLDVMSSNFEEWMKMATDNVCVSILFIIQYINECFRKLMLQIHGTLL